MTEPSEVGDMFAYEVPEVIYRPSFNETGEMVGYVVDPPFPDDRDHLATLRHFAALIEHRTALKVRVSPDPHTPPDFDDLPQTYHVLTGHATGGPAPYEVTWSWLSGFETGVQELLWKASKEQSGKDFQDALEDVQD